MKSKSIILVIVAFFLICCGNLKENGKINNTADTSSIPLFTVLPASKTNLKFVNKIVEGPGVNGLVYEYLYNGGGVATGDFNNDGLQDLYFISNLHPNKFYLNEGEMVFRETTTISGLSGNTGFPTGVTTVDINSDGLLDIYVSKSGKYPDPAYRKNELYINLGVNNKGIPTFKEDAKKYGLDLSDYSTQATFFDYDRDGDLDMFLLNHNVDPGETELNFDSLLYTKSVYSNNKLFQNNHGKYVDVSEKSGIINNSVGYGLGIAISDLNNDQWPDIIVGMDYSGKDHLYINNRDGTFKEVMNTATNHISNASMGNDVSDVNNDGWMDFISVDMAANNNYDRKTMMGGMSPRRFNGMVDKGMHYQYMFNTFQLNNGNMLGNGSTPVFSEIAHYAGLATTNWSWAPLFFDMDNDGLQDLFVTNGILRSFRNNDFVIRKRKHIAKLYEDLKIYKNRDSLIAAYYNYILADMPQKKEVNLFYRNKGDLTFEEMGGKWKLDMPTASNGGVYVDLDNDGDLDIVCNNINDPVLVYENNTRDIFNNRNYIIIKFQGTIDNINGIGAKVIVETKDQTQVKENYVSRGFQSSVSNVLHFGVGPSDKISKVKVQWPDGNIQILESVKVGQTLLMKHSESKKAKYPDKQNTGINTLFTHVSEMPGVNYEHQENKFDDYKRESLLPHKYSQYGPSLAVADVNGDMLDDFFVGGAQGQSGALFLQLQKGGFSKIQSGPWEKDIAHEDVGAAFLDADNDGDMDLYVASGGNEKKEGHLYYQDRFYENIGNGKFVRNFNALPELLTSGSCVKPADFDGDGDLDLFIGGKLIPGKYPQPASSYILRNESANEQIKFKNVTREIAPFLLDLGMVSSAEWSDLDGDGRLDLIVVCEWMPIKIFLNKDKGFVDSTNKSNISNNIGWWYSVAAADFDGDGDQDLIAGNLGLNYKYKATNSEPFEVFAKDFDKNGSYDIVLSYHEQGKLFPLRGRKSISQQMPFVGKKFPTYDSFASADVFTIYGQKELENALHYKANTFATVYLENLGGLKFKKYELPGLSQFSSVNTILVNDFNGDGNLDLVLSGNRYQVEVETVRNDASYGVFLSGNGKGEFTPYYPYQSGLFVKGDVKQAHIISNTARKNNYILFANNNDKLVWMAFDSSNVK